ncbi:MAG: tRNA (adenosine(37)-N6)-dimethylallyltransferase MiaA [Parcubacteria group bacterium CG2_30_36_21]|nr:MAG: tRNA (adenosine(37)-N6)-dimethylallyltransferase MiaA [Parcubacteria group bacterium CG2_30_36_21]
MSKQKLIVILGPTASGKSELAIKLALRLGSGQAKKKFGINGAEIISADSRQIYRGMDIGTGKITKKEMHNIPHHLLDVASPKRKFTVAQYRKLALKSIDKIFKKGKIPILVGGTGFYIQALVDGIVIPEVKPDWKLRKRLEKKSIKKLYEILKKMDPRRVGTIEKENPRRLIRAIEIVLKTKRPVPPLKFNPLPYPVLMIGIKRPEKELKQRIKKRFFEWLKRGVILEVIKLRKMGVSFKRIGYFGMHYREIAKYLQNKIDEKEMIENSIKEIQNYTKRQMTWFKKDKRIKWVKIHRQAERLLKEFLE